MEFLESLQQWFAPILWMIATVTALVGFGRLLKPLLQSRSNVTTSIENLDKKMDLQFAMTTEQISKMREDLEAMKERDEINDKGTESLLRDRILQIHRFLAQKQCITKEEYETVSAMFEVYKKLGGNHFVDKLMRDINKMKIVTIEQ